MDNNKEKSKENDINNLIINYYIVNFNVTYEKDYYDNFDNFEKIKQNVFQKMFYENYTLNDLLKNKELYELQNNFNYFDYSDINLDLKYIYNKNYSELVRHYLLYGKKENRRFMIPEKIEDIFKDFYDIDVFVYCGGKCGSTTLYETFINNGYHSFHVHNNDYFLNHLLPKRLINKYDLFDIIKYNKGKKDKIYVIDSYRKPIERKISSFFQNLEILVPNYKELSIHKLINIFNDDFLHDLEEYHSIDEILDYFKIGTFNEFDFKNKYVKKNFENIDFIKIRFDDVNEWDQILSKIFEKPIVLHKANLTENKTNSDLYKIFKEEYLCSQLYLEYIESGFDKTFNIYNTEDEKKTYLKYWSKKSR